MLLSVYSCDVLQCSRPPVQAWSVVIPKDELRYTARLRRVFDLIFQAVDGFGPALQFDPLYPLNKHSTPRPHCPRRGESLLVEPVVQDHIESVDHADRPEQARRGPK